MSAVLHDFPPWLIFTSLSLAAGAALLLIYGSRRPSVAALPAPPPVVLAVPPDAPAPPAPAPPVAAPAGPLPAGAERRVGYRRIGNAVEVLVCDEAFKQTPRRGWVVDRSRHGVRLALLEKYANGTVLQIRPAAGPDSAPWLAVEVRNAQPGDDSWELGCRFVSEPSWELLLLLG